MNQWKERVIGYFETCNDYHKYFFVRVLGAYYHDFRTNKLFFSLDFTLTIRELQPCWIIYENDMGDLSTMPYLRQWMKSHPSAEFNSLTDNWTFA